jgi:hypothetical protein
MSSQSGGPLAANPSLSVHADTSIDPVKASRPYLELLRLFERAEWMRTRSDTKRIDMDHCALNAR